MSLYNNISSALESVASLGIGSSIRGTISNATNSIAGSAAKALGGGAIATRATKALAGYATSQAMTAVRKVVPPQMERAIFAGASVIPDVMNGNWEQAGLTLWDSGIIGQFLPTAMRSLYSQSRYWGTPTPAFGGLSPAEAREIYDEIRGENLAKRNLFLVELSSSHLGGAFDIPHRLNLLATEVEYQPFILTENKTRIGAVCVDTTEGSEACELQITTLDDSTGSVKRWFATMHSAVAQKCGTVGVPGDYAIRVRVLHNFCTETSNSGGYEDVGLFRPTNLSLTLSRRDDELAEIQMTFTQVDSFML